jgi:hypothetical protein
LFESFLWTWTARFGLSRQLLLSQMLSVRRKYFGEKESTSESFTRKLTWLMVWSFQWILRLSSVSAFRNWGFDSTLREASMGWDGGWYQRMTYITPRCGWKSTGALANCQLYHSMLCIKRDIFFHFASSCWLFMKVKLHFSSIFLSHPLQRLTIQGLVQVCFVHENAFFVLQVAASIKSVFIS